MTPERLAEIRNQPFTFGDTEGSHITWWEQERLELLAEIDRMQQQYEDIAVRYEEAKRINRERK